MVNMDTVLGFMDYISESNERMWKLIMRNLGIRVNCIEAEKKFAFKKYGRRFAYRWLTNDERAQAFQEGLERLKD